MLGLGTLTRKVFGTPNDRKVKSVRPVVAQINALTARALADPQVKTRYGDLGASTWPTSPVEIAAFRDSEQARLLPVMKAAGIKPE